LKKLKIKNMGTIDGVLVEIDSMTKNANLCKEMIIDKLFKDGIINQEIASEYTEKYQIIIVKKSWFKKWLDKFSDNKEDSYVYKLVKFED